MQHWLLELWQTECTKCGAIHQFLGFGRDMVGNTSVSHHCPSVTTAELHLHLPWECWTSSISRGLFWITLTHGKPIYPFWLAKLHWHNHLHFVFMAFSFVIPSKFYLQEVNPALLTSTNALMLFNILALNDISVCCHPDWEACPSCLEIKASAR